MNDTPIYTITADELTKIRELRGLQDHHAQALGVATLQWRGVVNTIEERIKKTENAQQIFGEGVLRRLNLNTEKGVYRFDETNCAVYFLEAGQWVSVTPELVERLELALPQVN